MPRRRTGERSPRTPTAGWRGLDDVARSPRTVAVGCRLPVCRSRAVLSDLGFRPGSGAGGEGQSDLRDLPGSARMPGVRAADGADLWHLGRHDRARARCRAQAVRSPAWRGGCWWGAARRGRLGCWRVHQGAGGRAERGEMADEEGGQDDVRRQPEPDPRPERGQDPPVVPISGIPFGICWCALLRPCAGLPQFPGNDLEGARGRDGQQGADETAEEAAHPVADRRPDQE